MFFKVVCHDRLEARLHWRIVDEMWLRNKGHQNFFVVASTFILWAGVAALTETHPDAARMAAVCELRRNHLIDQLEKNGMNPAYTPGRAFYLLKIFSHLASDSLELAFDILEKQVPC